MDAVMLAFIVIYLVAMFVVGAVLARRVRDDDDYLLAGRKLGPMLVAGTLLATNFGGAFVLGTSQDAYAIGFAAIAFAIGICIGLVILGLAVARPMRRQRYVTVPDFLADRFGSTTVRLLASGLSIVALTGILAAQVGAAAAAFSPLGIEPVWGAVLAAVLFIAYTVLSGMWGVAVTDFIQFWIITVGLVIVAIIAVSAAGGLAAIGDAFVASGIDAPFNPLSQGWHVLLGAALPVIVHKMVGQDVLQRVFAARSANAARLGACIAGVLTALFAVVPALAGMAARALFPDLDPSVGVMPTLISEVLPSWAAGLLIAAILAAVMSTADTLLLAAVSNISNDLVLRFTRLGDQPRTLLIVTRVITVVVGLLALGMSLLVPGIIAVLTVAFTLYGSAVFVPMMFGLFTRFGGWQAALVAMLAGALTGLLSVLGAIAVPVLPGVAVAVLVSAVAYALTALVFPGRPRAQAVEREDAHA